MSHAAAMKWVIPDQKTPRVLGTLHLIFGGYLLFSSLWTISMYTVSPVASRVMEQFQKRLVVMMEDEKKAKLAEIAQEESAATTAAEKSALQSKRTAIQNQPNPFGQMKMNQGFDVINDRRVTLYGMCDEISGMILQIGLLVAGVGLIHLVPKGRKFALAVAGLQIVRTLAFAVISYKFIVPITMQRFQASMVQQPPQNAAQMPAFFRILMSQQGMAAVTSASVGFQIVLACIYPTIVLVLLNKTRVRAAFQEKKQPANPELAG